ncbi:MAG TPA: hypothetical protein VHG52_03135, partial [Thermomicrobiales bacterium]|nr:hypothetical protein [Thermomicrobiales bacterium]
VIVALPAYLILVAVGIVVLWRSRWLWPLGVVALVVITSYSWATLRDVNLAHSAEKEDWRSAYALIADQSQPGDVILTHPGYILTTYEYFKQREPRLQELDTVTIPSFQVNWLNEENMVEWIVNRAGRPDRIWYVESPDRVLPEDPERTLESWLTENSDALLERDFNGVRLILYDVRWPEG